MKVQGNRKKMKDYTIMPRGIYDVNIVSRNLQPYFGVKRQL